MNERIINQNPGNELYICGQTFRSLSSKIRAKEIGFLTFKSYKFPIYIPLCLVNDIPETPALPIGRNTELTYISNTIEDVFKGKRSSAVVYMEGHPGLGKSTLLSAVKAHIMNERPQSIVFTGVGDSIESTTRFYLFRSILSKMIDLVIFYFFS